MSELDDAIEALSKARPNPATVQALTYETIRRRETPYTAADVWGPYATYGGRNPDALNHCVLCGAAVSAYVTQAGDRANVSLGMGAHLDWHNDLERRLQRMEDV